MMKIYEPMRSITFNTSVDDRIFINEFINRWDKGDNRMNNVLMEVASTKLNWPFRIDRVLFKDPATIIFWSDGTKTVVKCSKDDKYDRLTGFLLCVMKKAYGNKGKYNNVIREFCPIDICEGGDA